MSDLKQTLPSSTRALPFTNDPTTVQTITTTDNVVFTLDENGATDGTTVSLSILQNHPVDFPASFVELVGSRPPVMGKMNYYILTLTNGAYQFIRYQSIDDAVDNSDVVEVGKTQLSVGTAGATTIALSWTAATNATQYVLKRYTAPDYSDVPVTVYTGTDISFTDTGLTAGTHYYYKINPATVSVTGRAAYADTATANNSYSTIYEKIFDDLNDTGQYIGAEGNFEIVQDEGVNKIKLTGVNGKQQIAWHLGGGYSANDHLRLTVTGVKLTNGTGFGIYLSGTGNINFPASDIHNEVVIENFVPFTDEGFCYLGIANGDSTQLLMRSIKIEKSVVDTVGPTALTVGNVSTTTVVLSWAAATNANQYFLKRYTTPDYSDAPVTIYTGSDLDFTDTGLTAGTHYYYGLSPASSSASGVSAYADIMTNSNSVILYERVFDDLNNTGQGIGAQGNYEIVQDEGINKLHLSGRNEKQQIAYGLDGGFQSGDTLRITFTGIRVVGKTDFGIYLTGNKLFSTTEIVNETISKAFTVDGSPTVFYYFGLESGDLSDIYLRSIKIENLTPAATN